MAGIPPFEDCRLGHINFVTNDLHDGVNCIYESMCDKDYPNLKKIIKTMTATLKGITESIEEED
jgi:hypothetical protein